jgi:hypothetical protein
MRLRAIVPLFLSLVALVAACGKDATQPTGEPSAVSFTYAGYRSGGYSATGFPPDVRTGTRWTTQWATAGNFVLAAQPFTGITASLPVAGANHLVELAIPFGATGTFALSPTHGDALIFDFQSGVSNGVSYVFKPGTVTITSATSDRVVGTFSGTAVDTLTSRTITVTNGKFDVHVDQP